MCCAFTVELGSSSSWSDLFVLKLGERVGSRTKGAGGFLLAVWRSVLAARRVARGIARSLFVLLLLLAPRAPGVGGWWLRADGDEQDDLGEESDAFDTHHFFKRPKTGYAHSI